MGVGRGSVLAFLVATSAAAPAQADQWGCEVLLCLSNPAGPTAVAQCVPPIKRLWRHLAKRGSFPTCAEANGQGGELRNTWAAYSHWCPKHLEYIRHANADRSEFACNASGSIDVRQATGELHRIWWGVVVPAPGLDPHYFGPYEETTYTEVLR